MFNGKKLLLYVFIGVVCVFITSHLAERYSISYTSHAAEWSNEDAQNAKNAKNDASTTPPEEEFVVHSRDDIAVAQVIQEEANGLPFQEQVDVGLTIYYRMANDRWPDTIIGNIIYPNQYARSKTYTKQAMEAALEAKRIYEAKQQGEDVACMPENFMSFFGYKRHNWFYWYDGKNQPVFYQIPDVTLPDDIYEAFERIVLGVET